MRTAAWNSCQRGFPVVLDGKKFAKVQNAFRRRLGLADALGEFGLSGVESRWSSGRGREFCGLRRFGRRAGGISRGR